MNRELLVIDLETTGFNKRISKIVEVGIVSLDIDTGEKRKLFDQVVHERPCTEEEYANSWIVKNGYISLEAIMHLPDLKI